MATRRAPLLTPVLALTLLLTVTEGRVRAGDEMRLNAKAIQGLLRDSEPNLKIQNIISLIKMMVSRQGVELKAESRPQRHEAENQFELKTASLLSADTQKRSAADADASHADAAPGIAIPLKQKRKSSDKNLDEKGEHLNPTDFNNADKTDKETLDRPEGAHDPTENKDGTGRHVIQGDIVQDERQGRNMIINEVEMWPRGEIPYVIASGFTERERATIAKAVLEFERNTCIRVRPLGPRDNANDGYVRIIKGSGCYSSVGRQRAANPSRPGQELSLGNGCLYPGIVVHEFMHALGFWHEQSRPDRDAYIHIHYENIQVKKEYNFEKYGYDKVQDLGTSYDVGSVMHYGPYAFARDRSRPTITAKKQKSVTMGQREGLSSKDINKINKLYKCKEVTVPPTPTVRPGECTNRNKYCKDWASAGECTKNPLYMKMHCAKSCNTCSKESCQDLNKYCAAWAETGECTKTPSYMSLYCKQSCGICEGGSNIACNNVSPYCEPWAEQGECQKNPDYMNVSCRKACGLC